MEVKDFRVACGDFIDVGDVEREQMERPGRAIVPPGVPYAERMFTVRALGESMEPRIVSGEWPIFHFDVVGSRQDRIVLVEDLSKPFQNRYTLKKYRSVKIYLPDGTWIHDEIWLLSLNPGFPPIRLLPDGNYRIRGWLVGTVPQITYVDTLQYPDEDREGPAPDEFE
jgi:phage repressor protein C with HTH and peptisase S24 domain